VDGRRPGAPGATSTTWADRCGRLSTCAYRGLRLGGGQEQVPGVAALDDVGGAAGEVDAAADVETGHETGGDDAGGTEPVDELGDGGGEGVVVALDTGDRQPGRLDDRCQLGDRSGIGESGESSGEAAQVGVEAVGVEPHVGDADPSAGAHGAGELGGGGGLVGEGAERALAHDRVEAGVGDR
jgi:hypothetical protein